MCKSYGPAMSIKVIITLLFRTGKHDSRDRTYIQHDRSDNIIRTDCYYNYWGSATHVLAIMLFSNTTYTVWVNH